MIESARPIHAKKWFGWSVTKQIQKNYAQKLAQSLLIFKKFPTKVRPSFESFSSVGTFNIIPFVQVSHISQMADVVVLFFLFEFRGRSAFEYASKCSFSQTITKLGTSSFIWYLIYYWKVTQTKLLSSFIQSFRLNLNAFYTFDPKNSFFILVNQIFLYTYILWDNLAMLFMTRKYLMLLN